MSLPSYKLPKLDILEEYFKPWVIDTDEVVSGLLAWMMVGLY